MPMIINGAYVTDTKGLIYGAQLFMLSKPEIVGYGNNSFCLIEIEPQVARDIIIKNHYSHKAYNLSYIHLGVYVDGVLSGVLQYGYVMNPASGDSIVPGTGNDGYLELNRMWIADGVGVYPESRAISYSIKYIRNKWRKVKWIQSFADERCKCFGVVYQACSFGYYGEHNNVFWELDGVIYHNLEMTVTPESERYSKTSAMLQARKDEAKRMILRQFRYIKHLDDSTKSECTLRAMPYPKWGHTARAAGEAMS
jgi:hypothetical protein